MFDFDTAPAGAPEVALVLSGGVALGAYQAGAYAALHEHERLRPHCVAAASIGAINGALILGTAPDRRVDALRQFWNEGALDTPWPLAVGGERAASFAAVGGARLLGRPGHFSPRVPTASRPALYSLDPLAHSLARRVDFDRLNAADHRFVVATTDIECGEAVMFDTRRGQHVEMRHLLATSGFVPEFPPIEIEGRLLGDGGFIANAPVEAVLRDEARTRDLVCFIVELFCVEGARPRSVEEGVGRRSDLLLGCQTLRILDALEREHRLRCALASLRGESQCPRVKVLHLRYRAPRVESGFDKMFDYSRTTLTRRWDAGYRDMQTAVRVALGGAQSPDAEGQVSCREWLPESNPRPAAKSAPAVAA